MTTNRSAARRWITVVAVLTKVLCSQTVAQEHRDARESFFQLGAHGGSPGLGVSAGFDLSDRFAVRGLFSTFDYGFNIDRAGNAYDGDLALQSFGILADWHLSGGGWRLTGGAFQNNNELLIGTEATNIGIGNRRYTGNLDITLNFAASAPYFGIGWASGRGRPGVSFGFDAGALYQGSPRLSATGTVSSEGLSCPFAVTRNASASVDCPLQQLDVPDDARALLQREVVDPLIENLETEHTELSDSLGWFQWYPIVSFGVSYRF